MKGTAALAEDPGSVLRIHMGAHINYSRSNVHFSFPWTSNTLNAQTHMLPNTYSQKIKINHKELYYGKEEQT